jgi:hypothetical protein
MQMVVVREITCGVGCALIGEVHDFETHVP